MPLRYGHTLSNSRLDFENLTQSEAREPPTSGHKSVMEGPTMVLILMNRRLSNDQVLYVFFTLHRQIVCLFLSFFIGSKRVSTIGIKLSRLYTYVCVFIISLFTQKMLYDQYLRSSVIAHHY